jgi:hypothetical protein
MVVAGTGKSLPLRAFDIHLDKVHRFQFQLGNELVDRSQRDALPRLGVILADNAVHRRGLIVLVEDKRVILSQTPLG